MPGHLYLSWNWPSPTTSQWNHWETLSWMLCYTAQMAPTGLILPAPALSGNCLSWRKLLYPRIPLPWAVNVQWQGRMAQFPHPNLRKNWRVILAPEFLQNQLKLHWDCITNQFLLLPNPTPFLSFISIISETTPQEIFCTQIISQYTSRWTRPVIVLKSWPNCIRPPADSPTHHLTTWAKVHQGRGKLPPISLFQVSKKTVYFVWWFSPCL